MSNMLAFWTNSVIPDIKFYVSHVIDVTKLLKDVRVQGRILSWPIPITNQNDENKPDINSQQVHLRVPTTCQHCQEKTGIPCLDNHDGSPAERADGHVQSTAPKN